MLYQELPSIESTPLDRWGRWLAPALIMGAALTAAILCVLWGKGTVAAALIGIGFVGAVVAYVRAPSAKGPVDALAVGPDFGLLGSALSLSSDPVALTSGEGSLLVVNSAYRERFGTQPPIDVAASDDARTGLQLAQSMAWRDGAGCV